MAVVNDSSITEKKLKIFCLGWLTLEWSRYSARHRLGNGRIIEILTSMLHFIDKVISLIKKNNVLPIQKV